MFFSSTRALHAQTMGGHWGRGDGGGDGTGKDHGLQAETLPDSDQHQGLGRLSPQHPGISLEGPQVGGEAVALENTERGGGALGSGGGLSGEVEAGRPSKGGPKDPFSPWQQPLSGLLRPTEIAR